ncbi:hypothetical protein [Alkalihalobacillus sp. BA299]|uniref:hypothetical protein n=1 Tax=Alkalihalobacillus sp. BA299 TaxID=2815938 RepID=UPI0027DC5624|nr:hypothetical protein [Alkalihalobacillus sp. BA299]
MHLNDSKAGIQLSYAGRKADVSGQIIGPSPIPFAEDRKTPLEMSIEDIQVAIGAL